MLPLFCCAALEVGLITLGDFMPSRWIFSIHPENWGYETVVVLSSVMCVAIAVKIWNNTRIEMNLEQNQQHLLKARMDALTSQINPHFLFNTLNTVSSLIRFDPDMARGVVLKLSNILRRLLRKHETFVPLREELDFIDDYLDIEVIRFGRDKLQIFKEIDDETLDAFVPSMLLQPIVENAIKHGLAPRLEGGEIHIRTRRREGRLVIEIDDNGMGISSERLAGGLRRRHRDQQRPRAFAASLRGSVRNGYSESGGRRHADPDRDSRACHSGAGHTLAGRRKSRRSALGVETPDEKANSVSELKLRPPRNRIFSADC